MLLRAHDTEELRERMDGWMDGTKPVRSRTGRKNSIKRIATAAAAATTTEGILS